MNAAQLKLNYPEILEEIIRKVDSAVLSSKSPSILERVKCCSQSILSKKDLDLKVVAAGSLMTFLLTKNSQPCAQFRKFHLGIPRQCKIVKPRQRKYAGKNRRSPGFCFSCEYREKKA